MIRAFRAALAAVFVMTGGAAMSETHMKILSFDDLDGWASDDHEAARQVFLNTCTDFDAPDWQTLCGAATGIEDARKFFELLFRPVLIEEKDKSALFTGYFEPELEGALTPSGRYRFPVYKMPREAKAGQWLTRREIETSGALQGRGLEIAWVDDSVELFFLQIQGSGRIRLPNGSYIRVGYGGANGHKYRSIGAELVRRGVYNAHQVSAQVIKNWVKRNPVDGAELLRHNDSFVFFSGSEPRASAQRPFGGDEPVNYRYAVSGGGPEIHPARRAGLGGERWSGTAPSVDDCAGHRFCDQRCAAG